MLRPYGAVEIRLLFFLYLGIKDPEGFGKKIIRRKCQIKCYYYYYYYYGALRGLHVSLNNACTRSPQMTEKEQRPPNNSTNSNAVEILCSVGERRTNHRFMSQLGLDAKILAAAWPARSC